MTLRRALGIGMGVAGLLAAGAALGLSDSAVVRAPTDFSIFYAAARVLAAGGNPYDWHALRHVVATVPAPGYMYPLWGLALVAPFAWLPLAVAAGIRLMLNLAALLIALRLLGRAAGIPGRSYLLPVLFGLTCLSIPGLFVLIQGQIALILLALIVAALVLARAGRGGWAGVLLACALVKPQLTWLPALVVLAVAVRGGVGRRALLGLAGTLAACAGLSFALRPQWLGDWLRVLKDGARQSASGTATANMGTLPSLAAHLPPALGAALLLVATGAAAALLLWQARRGGFARAETASAATDLRLLAVAICLVTVLSPWTFVYDGVLWLVPVVVALRTGPAWRGWAALAVFWALPWATRLASVAATRGGTPLNHLEDVLIAPLLLALVLLPGAVAAGRLAIPASASQRPTPADQRT
ncbi:MAG TPA: glycosyltransferase family 87 protein [Ktedonobacterales bacterium]|jgi:hypothetical protein